MSRTDEASGRHLWNLRGIPMEFERRNVKHLRIGIYAPHGAVRVAAPRRMAEETVRNFVISRIPWIERKRAELTQRRPRPAPQLVSGEVHYYRGVPHVLAVSEGGGRPGLRRGDSTLHLQVAAGSDRAGRLRVLNAWYRRELNAQLQLLLPAWEGRLNIKVAQLRIRQMRTRWGSCNARARRVCLNLDLIRRSPRCLEYVLVHELVHFFERGHNARFYGLMARVLPQWRDCRAELNRSLAPVEARPSA